MSCLNNELSELERLLVVSLEEMVISYRKSVGVGHGPTFTTASKEEEIVVATIGFEGARGKGVVTLLSSRRVADCLKPGGLALSDELALCDVFGELANMVAGRLKSLLSQHGVAISITTPSTGIARNMRLNLDDEDHAFADYQRFTLGSRGHVFMRVDASFSDIDANAAEVAAAIPTSTASSTALEEDGFILFEA